VLAAQDERSRPMRPAFVALDPAEAEAREREIGAVLGAEKAAQFTELRRGMPARVEVRIIRQNLENLGVPVTAEQERQLVAMMKNSTPPEPPRPNPGQDPLEASEQFRAWRAERSKYVRDNAAPLLTPRQLERLDESEALQAAMQAAMPPLNLAPSGGPPPSASSPVPKR
jgi:hypothetical protein